MKKLSLVLAVAGLALAVPSSAQNVPSGVVLLDPDRSLFRAVIGATPGRPVVVADARSVFPEIPRPGNAVRLDEKAAADLLQRAGVARPAQIRLHITALSRAAARAMAE